MDNTLHDLVRDDPRYPVEAYEFLCDAVEYTQSTLGREPREDDPPDADYHVGGEDLARGACEMAVEEFGLMAGVVFRQWGVRTHRRHRGHRVQPHPGEQAQPIRQRRPGRLPTTCSTWIKCWATGSS